MLGYYHRGEAKVIMISSLRDLIPRKTSLQASYLHACRLWEFLTNGDPKVEEGVNPLKIVTKKLTGEWIPDYAVYDFPQLALGALAPLLLAVLAVLFAIHTLTHYALWFSLIGLGCVGCVGSIAPRCPLRYPHSHSLPASLLFFSQSTTQPFYP